MMAQPIPFPHFLWVFVYQLAMFLTSVFIRCLYVVVRCVCVGNTNIDDGGDGDDDDCSDDGSNNGPRSYKPSK